MFAPWPLLAVPQRCVESVGRVFVAAGLCLAFSLLPLLLIFSSVPFVCSSKVSAFLPEALGDVLFVVRIAAGPPAGVVGVVVSPPPFS